MMLRRPAAAYIPKGVLGVYRFVLRSCCTIAGDPIALRKYCQHSFFR